MNKYLHKIIEKYVQIFWKKNKTFKSIDNINLDKYYCLSMFPYPSGSLHIGHIRNYTIGDILSRFNRMNGKNVLYPIGWDSFGLPAENAAINNNISPKKWTFSNINYMRKQLKILGFSFDWDREIITCNKNYYKWEQIFFKKLYKNNIVYKKYYPVNWCNLDKTVLANEQVINNNCWRCNNKIYIKYIDQWFIKITNYSEKLLKDLDKLKYWPNKVKIMQKNWIGKSLWIKINFFLINLNNEKITINFKNINEFLNVNYIILSNKNILFYKILKIFKDKKCKYYNNILKYLKKYKYLKTNILAINNLINKYIPIILLDKNYMLYILKIKYIEKSYNFKNIFNIKIYNNFFLKNKNSINFMDLYDYLYELFCLNKDYDVYEKYKILNKFDCKNFYKYKIKDWCISRQRKWGVPIPIAKLNNGKLILIPNKFIPIEPINTNKKIKYKNYILIKDKYAIKEEDTLDTFIQSSWYYIRYTCPKYKKSMINYEISNYWLPIDQYIGGIEHATMHLLYFRFYNKLLKDFNLLKYDEPAIKLLCQGMVLSKSYYYINEKNTKVWVNNSDILHIYNNKKKCFDIFDKYNNKLVYDGISKMSKSKNNGIDPLKLVDKYGADTLRTFLVFSSPSKSDLLWDDTKIIGIYRFLNKVWLLVFNHLKNKNNNNYFKNNYKNKFLLRITYESIKNITNDLKIKQSFNTSVSYLMSFTNNLLNEIKNKNYNYNFIQDLISVLLRMLYPFAPHISFFLWNKIGFSNIDYYEWPNFNKYKITDKNIEYLIQINNKFKFKIDIDIKNNNKDKILEIICNNYINKTIINNKILNIIFIKNKLLNIILENK